jgi:hypothetical protein
VHTRELTTRKALEEAKILSEVAKEELSSRNYDNEIKKLKERITELEVELENYKREVVINELNDDVISKILELRAKNYSPDIIEDKLNYINVSVSMIEIEQVINNIESLKPEHQKKFKQYCQDYEDSIKMNPSILKQSNIMENQFCIDEARKIISTTYDEDAKGKWMDRLDKYINTKTKLLGDVVLNSNSELDMSSRIVDIRENLEARNERILKNFDSSRLRVVK